MEQDKSRTRRSATKQPDYRLLTRNPDVRPSSIPFDESGDVAIQVREEALSRLKLERDSLTRKLARQNAELEARNRELLEQADELRAANQEAEKRMQELARENEELKERLWEWLFWGDGWCEWLEGAGVGCLVLDMELRIRQFNTLFAREIPLTPYDLQRPFDPELCIPFDNRLYADIVSVARSLIPIQRELKSPSGCWYSLIALPCFSWDRKPQGIVITLRDITELKQATADLLKLSHAVEQSHSIILIAGIEGEVEYINLKFSEQMGYRSDEVLGQPVSRFHPAELDGVPFGEVWASVCRGERWAGEIEMVRENGDRFWEGAALMPIRNRAGKIVHVLKMSQNITEHKTAEELLRKSEMLSAMGELAAGVAHEIRNPLTALKGFTKLIERGAVNPAYTRIMAEELQQIENIINEFLVLAKPQAWCFEKKQISEIVEQALALLRSEMDQRQVRVATTYHPGLPPVSCVESQMKQVVLHLLKNSLEAVSPGGKIQIEAGLCEDEHLFVRIVDDGCGIPEEKLAKLGEPFYSTKEKGTGLGLMVSFKIIENHRGTYSVTSESNCGTTLEFRLPLDR
ncbi:ATP-binding protein [Gorillibacterium sp. CAU 1737]|uniref:ATP-binding protein n=1 Tax=Gorillibacterium sp. CAU 1737 TaxID=3140362 RepID=UPI003260FDEC